MKKLFLDALSLCISLFGSVVVFLALGILGAVLDADKNTHLWGSFTCGFLSFFFIFPRVVRYMRKEYLD